MEAVCLDVAEKPKSFPLSIAFAIQGFHLRKVAKKIHVPPIRDVDELEQAVN